MNLKRPRLQACVILAMAASLCGCATLPLIPSGRTPEPVLAEVKEYYSYNPLPLKATFSPMSPEPSSRWIAQHVTLEVEGQTLPIQMDWYAPPHAQKAPVVLIFPILWGNDLGVKDFAQGFAREGIHGIIVYRPKEKFSMEKPLSQIEEHFHATVVNARRVIDWLETQPNVDTSKIGSLGISMGATLNVVVAVAEPRIQRYVFCLPASHMAEVIITTRDHSISKKRDEYLKRYRMSQKEAQAQLETLFKSEPLRVAHSIDPKKSMMVIAMWDRVIGRKNSIAIWRALGKPRALWIPTGHYTALFALPYVKMKVLWFFQDWSSSGKRLDRNERTADRQPSFDPPLWPPTFREKQK